MLERPIPGGDGVDCMPRTPFSCQARRRARIDVLGAVDGIGQPSAMKASPTKMLFPSTRDGQHGRPLVYSSSQTLSAFPARLVRCLIGGHDDEAHIHAFAVGRRLDQVASDTPSRARDRVHTAPLLPPGMSLLRSDLLFLGRTIAFQGHDPGWLPL